MRTYIIYYYISVHAYYYNIIIVLKFLKFDLHVSCIRSIDAHICMHILYTSVHAWSDCMVYSTECWPVFQLKEYILLLYFHIQ